MINVQHAGVTLVPVVNSIPHPQTTIPFFIWVGVRNTICGLVRLLWSFAGQGQPGNS